MPKIYKLIDLFDFPEGTTFIVNTENDEPTFEVWIEDNCLCFEDKEGEYEDNMANITKAWLNSTFTLKE